MFKYQKYSLIILTFTFLVTSFIELIKYLCIDTTLFGVIYLLINLVILFFLLPVLYNYKKNFSKARISKLIIIVLLGIFNSYILEHIVVSSMSYTDTSFAYIKLIFIEKSIIKGIILFLLALFSIFESKLNEKIIKKLKNIEKS